MNTEIVVAMIALLGTILGSGSGVLVSNRLTSHRIEQLEKKVDKHNNAVERLIVVERDMKTAYSRIDELRSEVSRLRS